MICPRCASSVLASIGCSIASASGAEAVEMEALDHSFLVFVFSFFRVMSDTDRQTAALACAPPPTDVSHVFVMLLSCLFSRHEYQRCAFFYIEAMDEGLMFDSANSESGRSLISRIRKAAGIRFFFASLDCSVL